MSIAKKLNSLKYNPRPLHALKAYMGSTDIAPFIRNLGIRRKKMVNVTHPAALPPRRNLGTHPILDPLSSSSWSSHYTKLSRLLHGLYPS